MGFTYYTSTGGSRGYSGGSGSRTDIVGQNAIAKAQMLAQNPLLARDPELLRMFSEDPQSLERSAMAMGGALTRPRLAATADGYRSLPDTEREQLWRSMPEATRTALTREYNINPPGTESRGGLMGLLGTAAGGVGAVIGGVSNVLEPVVGLVPGQVRDVGKDMGGSLLGWGGEVLEFMDMVGDQPAHIFRTMHALLADAGIDLDNPAVAALVLGGLALSGVGAAALLGGTLIGGTIGAVGLAGVGAVGGAAAIGAVAAGMNTGLMYDAWQGTFEGDRYFNDESLAVAEELLGRDVDMLAFAKEIAAGVSVEEIALDRYDEGTPEFSATVQELAEAMGDETFQGAVAELNQGKVSPGRWMATAFTTMDKGSTKYNFVSGLVDAAVVVAIDPFLVVGRTAKAARLAKVGFSGALGHGDIATKLGDMWNSSRKSSVLGSVTRVGGTVGDDMKRAYTRIAQGWDPENAGGIADLAREMPALVPMLDTMRQWQDVATNGAFKLDDEGKSVLEFFQSADGVKALLSGRAGTHRDWIEAPTLTRVGLAKARKRRQFYEVIDWAADPEQAVKAEGIVDLIHADEMWLPRHGNPKITRNASAENIQNLLDRGLIDLSVYESGGITRLQQMYEGSSMMKLVFGGGGRFNVIQGGAKLAQGLTRQVPFGGNVVELFGTKGTQEMMNLVEMGGMMAHLPNSVKKMWIEEFVTSDEGMRRRGVQSFLYATMKHAGIGGDDVSDAYTDEFIQKLDQLFTTFKGEHLVGPNGATALQSTAGILPDADGAVKIRIPKMREMLGVSRKYSWTRRAHGFANPDLLYKGMDLVWKPSVLLRIGFIPRAAGEELLSTLMRYPSAFVTSKLLRFAADEIEYNNLGRPVGGLLPVGKKIAQVSQLATTRKIRMGADGKKIYAPRKFDWSEEARDLQDAQNVRSMVSDVHLRSLFGDTHTPMVERLMIATTTAARDVLRKQMLAGRLGDRMGDLSLVGARSLLTITDPGRFDELNKIDGALAALYNPGDPADNWAIEAFLTASSTNAAANVNGATSANAYLSEVTANMQKQLIPGNNAPDAAVGQALRNGEVSRLVPMQGAWGTLRAGDPLFAYSYYGAVTRFIKKDRIGREMGKQGHRYVNPAVRDELAASGLFAGDHRKVLERLHYNLGLEDAVGRGNPDGESILDLAQAYLARTNDAAAKDRLLTELLDTTPVWIPGGPFSGSTPSPTDIHKWVDELGALSTDAKGTINGLMAFDDFPDLIDDLAEFRESMIDVARRGLNDPNNATAVARSDRRQFGSLTGHRVAKNIPEGYNRAYMPLVDRNALQAYTHGNANVKKELEDRLLALGWDEAEIVNMRILNRKLSPSMPGEAGRKIDAERALHQQTNMAYSGNTVPLGGLGFSDHQDARRFAQDVADSLDEMAGRPKSTLDGGSIAYVDLEHQRIQRGLSPAKYGEVDAQVYQGGGANRPTVYKVDPAKYQSAHYMGPDTVVQEMLSPAGQSILVEGITAEQAIDEWAEVLVQRWEEIFTAGDGSGDVLSSLSGHNFTVNPQAEGVYNQSYFDAEHIMDVGEGRLPTAINAPRYTVEEKQGWWRKAVDTSFNKVISPAVDSIARQPLFTLEYVAAFKATMGNRKRLRNPIWVNSLEGDVLPRLAEDARIDFSSLNTGELEHLSLWLKKMDESGEGHMPLKAILAEMSGPWGPVGDFDKQFPRYLAAARAGKGGHAGLAENILPILEKIEARKRIPDIEDMLGQYRKAVGDSGAIKSFRDFKKVLEKHDGAIPWELDALQADEWKVLSELNKAEWAITQQMNVIASERAFNAVIPFIDDHRLRSQFQEWMHNYIPFHFAEEQFIKRWARTFTESPESIRRMQLTYRGMKSSGMVIDDPETGDKIFVMPGSAAATDILARVSEIVTGKEIRVPIAMPLTGRVLYSVPGLDSLGVPSVGPTVAIPLGEIAARFPELEPLQKVHEFVTGQDQPGRQAIWEQILPASVRRFGRAAFFDPNNRRTASHMASAIMYLDAAGYSPEENAGAGEKQEYLDRVREWTRSLALNEAIFGFIAPSSPSAGSIITGSDPYDFQTNIGLSVDEINDIPRPRFMELLDTGMDYDEAVLMFLEENPDATAYTVFESQSESGRSIPMGETAADWMFENKELLKEYTGAAAWLVPHAPRSDEFDWKASNEQYALGLRRRKDLDEFSDDVYFAAAMPLFEKMKEGHVARKEAADLMDGDAGLDARLAEADRWRQQQSSFTKMHPVWASIYSGAEGRNRRAVIIEQWSALGLSDYQPTERFHDLNGLFEMFQLYTAQKTQLIGRRGDEVLAFRKDLEDRFKVAAEAYVLRVPEAKEFWQSILRPEAF